MIFWASAEAFQPAYDALTATRRGVELYLNAALDASSLAALHGELRYVPIVMPEEMRRRYPARSKLRKKELVYLCAPQLNYEVFVSGEFPGQLHEYLRGVKLAAPELAGLGATAGQIAEFERILAAVEARILAERPDQARQ